MINKKLRQVFLFVMILQLLLNITSCKKTVIPAGKPPLILGHAGMGTYNIHPPNSAISIKKCLALGADGCEMDVQLTRDCVLVAFHHTELSACTREEGLISEHSWNELKNIRYTNKTDRFQTIVSLHEIFGSLNFPDNYFFSFDCKLYNGKLDANVYQQRFSNAIADFIQRFGLSGHIGIESVDTAFLNKIHRRTSGAITFLYVKSLKEAENLFPLCHFDGISAPYHSLSLEEIVLAKKMGWKVTLWGAGTTEENDDALIKSPDILQTDRVRYALRLLR